MNSSSIGIFGGTFDPIHFGHLRTAWEIISILQLHELRLIPCHLPPHRHAPKASAEHRFAMVEQAVQNIPAFQVDDCEIRRGGISYTVDTLCSFRRELPEHSLCLIVGMDAFATFMDWHSWEDIIKLANVVVVHRPGHQEPLIPQLRSRFHVVNNKAELQAQQCGALFFQPVTPLAISATAIRDEFARGGTARFLLPDNVINYIQTHHLYHSQE